MLTYMAVCHVAFCVTTKLWSHHLNVIYMCQKSLNFIHAFKCYKQKRKLSSFKWPTLYIIMRCLELKTYFSPCVRHHLELPGRYDQLKAFWEDKKGTLPPSAAGRTLQSSPSSDVLPADLKVWHNVAFLRTTLWGKKIVPFLFLQ